MSTGMLSGLVHLGIVVAAIAFAIFQAQPAPPQSPLVYQWRKFGGKYLKYKDHHIFYKNAKGNPSSSDNLIVLHGFPTSSYDFHLMTNALEKAFGRVIYLDFLGFGYSDKPRNHPYSIMEQADIVEFLMNALNISAYHILAHDYGGVVAQELLARSQDARKTIVSAVLVNGNIFPTVYRISWWQYLHKMEALGPILTRFANEWSFGMSLNNLFGDNSLRPYEVKSHWYFARLNDGYRRWTGLLRFLDEQIEHETRWLSALKSSKVPFCTILGALDPLNPREEFQKMYNHLIPSPCLRVIEDAGHFAHLEATDAVMKLYADFLREKTSMKIDDSMAKVVVPEKIPHPVSINE